MVDELDEPLIGRTRVTAWAFLVALAMALGFGTVGVQALTVEMLPAHLGVFVEPPSWLVGAALLAMAALLTLVGLFELVRWIKPAVEVVVDRDGVATHGLLGERRAAWPDIAAAEVHSGVVWLKLRRRGRIGTVPLNIDLARIDVDPRVLVARLRAGRPDLLAGYARL